MTFALSTNWNNGRLEDGAAIADEALELGFDSLELGFRTTPEQLDGFRRRLDRMPVTSVHAYCPVPPGAPSGHPELYQLASSNPDVRALARIHLKKTFALAAELGARAVVFHAGYRPKPFPWPFGRFTPDVGALFRAEFEKLAPELEKLGLVLCLENLPRPNAYPNADEAEALMKDFAGAPLKLWFDTGHARVRETNGWAAPAADVAKRLGDFVHGMHLNDVVDVCDDHLAPGDGKVDFAALGPLAGKVALRVFEPREHVTRDRLAAGLAHVRAVWS